MDNKNECNKVRFITRADAKRKIKELNKSHLYDRQLTASYLCDKCGYWHTTSQEKSAWQPNKKQLRNIVFAAKKKSINRANNIKSRETGSNDTHSRDGGENT